MFDGCKSLTNINLSSFNTEKVPEMDSMFASCSSLTTLDLSSFNTQKLSADTDMFDDDTGIQTLKTPGITGEAKLSLPTGTWICGDSKYDSMPCGATKSYELTRS